MKAASRSTPVQPTVTALAAVMLVSFDGVILADLHLGVATIWLVRGVLMATGYAAIMRLRVGPVARRAHWRLGRRGVAFACSSAAGNLFYVASLRSTTIAHALLLSATVPAITAGLTRLTRSEPMPPKTALAAVFVLVGVAGLVATSPGHTALVGDLEALGGAFALSAGLVCAPPDARLAPAQLLGAGFVVLVALPFADPATVGRHDAALAAVGFLLIVPIASSTMWSARRHLGATELSLLVMMESVFGPTWGWLCLGQVPTWQTVAAGAVILASVGWHALSVGLPGG